MMRWLAGTRAAWIVVSIVAAASLRADEPIIPPEAGLPVIDWKDAGKYMDRPVVVQGRIEATRNIGRICFLNFDKARRFTAVVYQPCYKNFPKPPEVLYAHKNVRIRGTISEYGGKPQIEVCRPEQVTILEKLEPIPPKPEVRPRSFDGTVTIGTFNTMNLFDTYDDPYHDDEGTPPKPRGELEKLAATIRSLDADVLALQEVENRDYLERFVTAMLGDMGYENVVCFESNDRRGIDCAVLSRFPVGPVTSHRHLRFDAGPIEPGRFRRDLLRVRIEPPGCPAFDMFVVHFKSKQGGEDTTTEYRLAEARQARAIFDDLLKHEKEMLFVVCGDFNDTWESKPLRTIRGEGEGVLRDFLDDLPEGTITYNKEPHRSMIDFILASPAMGDRYVEKTHGVIAGTIESGGSDHNPVRAKFRMGTKPQG